MGAPKNEEVGSGAARRVARRRKYFGGILAEKIFMLRYYLDQPYKNKG